MLSVREIAAVVGGVLTVETDAVPRRIVHDSRQTEPEDLFVALLGTRTDGHAFVHDAFERGACAAIVSSGRAAEPSGGPRIVVDDPLDALHRLASAWRNRLRATLVAVTGSNGKTTTRALLAHILRADASVHEPPGNYNTEIGLPLALLRAPASSEVGVFELGTEAPGEIRALAAILHPTVGILTGVGPSHLAGFGSVDAIAEEKWELARALPEDGLLFVNGDAGALRELSRRERPDAITVGLADADLVGRVAASVPQLVVEIDDPPLRLRTPLLGDHNVTNVLLAVACAVRFGVSPGTIEERIATFRPIEHRLTARPAPFGILLDDVYNANPASMRAALRTLARYGDRSARRVFVFGDMLDLGTDSERYHREIFALALELGIDVVVPVGPRAAAACETVPAACVVVAPPRERLSRLREVLSGPDDVALVKGSRDLRLERLVDDLLSPG